MASGAIDALLVRCGSRVSDGGYPHEVFLGSG